MGIQSIRGVVEAAIERASHATGVDFGFLMGTARRESGYNPRARAQGSSAAGLFQFVEQTWLATLKQHGPKYGYARYADLIEKGSDGRYRVSGGEAHRAVMDLRFDPQAAALMAGELTSDHASYIRGRLGRAPTAGELYAAHFLGPQGSARLIEAAQTNPGGSAAALFPGAAAANPSIFYHRGRAASVAEVYANLTSTGGGEPSAPQSAPVKAQAFVQYASARQIDRIQQQQAVMDLVLRGTTRPDAMGSSISDGLGGSLFDSAMLRVLSDAQVLRDRKG